MELEVLKCVLMTSLLIMTSRVGHVECGLSPSCQDQIHALEMRLDRLEEKMLKIQAQSQATSPTPSPTPSPKPSPSQNGG